MTKLNNDTNCSSQVILELLIDEIKNVHLINRSFKRKSIAEFYANHDYNHPLSLDLFYDEGYSIFSEYDGVYILCNKVANDMYGSIINEAIEYVKNNDDISVEKVLIKLPDTTGILIIPKYI